ncbi:MAG: PepSY domain-containing protein [Acidobacteriota bacterium]
MSRSCRRLTLLLCAVFGLFLASGLLAVTEPAKDSIVEQKAFRHADLDIPALDRQVGLLPNGDATLARQRLQRLGSGEAASRIDRRSGRFSTLLPATPLVPGDGVGNRLRWSDVALTVPQTAAEREQVVRGAFLDYLAVNQGDLDLDLAELSPTVRVTSHGDTIYQIYIQRFFDGIPVRNSYITGVVNHGNLVLVGLQTWGDRQGLGGSDTGIGGGKRIARALDADDALLAAESYLSPLQIERFWGKPELIFLPMAVGQKEREVELGAGYRYTLAWAIKAEVDGDRGSWEVLIDANTGEVLANEDRNHYAEAKGGVLPVTNDGIVPDGVEQPGWPMPFMTVGGETTDTGGNYSNSGSVTANLSGTYVRMNDNCGSISLTQSGGIDFGTSSGTDCTTPGFGGSGNTHSSRTGFYELNKLIEMARSQLPSNGWLQNRLTSNMNINSTCNAFWNGSTINFYRSGGGCANTGEIAGVFDHEWGHGIDDNDANPSIASPSGEGIADIYTALRLNSSCIGRNFRSTPCSGFGDPCLTCTGVRDIDYLQRQSGQPHDYSWSNANCSGSVHCVGSVYSEAVWSLWKRELQQAPYNYDNNTAHEIVNRLTFIGAGNVGTWFSGGPPFGGCGSSGGYLNYLAADDDNGNLNDGTPHMAAIYAAFNDQEIACNTPSVQDAGCSGVPTVAPSVNGSAGNQSASLSWSSVSGAARYEVFRTEGVFGCDFGKAKVADITGTSFTDTGLQNGREYSYVVIAKGSSDACFGPASSCTQVTPASAPDFTVSCSPTAQSISQNASGSASCTISSLGGYSGSVSLSCAGNPAGIGCSFAPSSVSVPAGGSASSTLTLNVALSQSTGTFNFDASGTDGSLTRTSGLAVTVTPEGQNGPQTAVFDAALGAPRCSVAGTECDSVGLLEGRANLGPEANQPNTLDGCTDGTSGSYQSDESNERIVVRTLDGFDFTEGATVEIAATVWAYSTGSSDTLDLYYAANANSPSWVYITSITPPAGGEQTLTAQYTLPAGSLQAVRASFRYQGSAAPCSTGNYDDADDLVFAVGGGTVNTAPTASITAPTSGSAFDEGTSVSFTGTATDTEDGTISGSLSWTSSLDGAIGSGASFSTSTLSVGSHTITAAVTDSGGLSDSDSISVTINPVSGGGVCNGTNCIDWDVTPTESYSNQDNASNVTIQDGGDSILLQDNTWRRTVGTYTVTANTVVEFDFTSTSQGEIHGIGLDEDNTLSADRIFKVHGTQAYGIQDFDNYTSGTVTYSIPVGQYFTGAAMNLVLVNDNDAGTGNDSTFSNVRIYEDTPNPACTTVTFESGAEGWTNDASSTCSTGAFVVGTPTVQTNGGVTTQVGGAHSGSNAYFSATNTSAGANDIDGGTCVAVSPVYSVSEASNVSAWFFHGQRDAGDDAGDFFSLEISTDGGSTWSTLQSYGDVTVNAAWTEATTTVSAGSNVRFRLSAADATADGDLVEAGIDDVEICPQ